MRIALVRSGGRAAWQSCVSITHNLARSYETIAGIEVRDFALDPSAMHAGIWDILEYEPDRMAIIDYGAFQPAFLKAWLESGADSRPIHLHCFGDFPLAAANWVELAPQLLGTPIAFIAASDASAELVGNLVGNNARIVLCPFPIDSEVFRPARREGQALRRSLGINTDELLLLYTGRLSLQKNTTLLTKLVRDYARSRNVEVTLAFAGEVDDIGADFLGIELETGFYRHHFFNELAETANGGPFRVAMLGNLYPDDLRRAYNAADAFVSLSMHHDEDFGMSPGESLCCGTPVILSGWGGFHSFQRHVSSAESAAQVISFESRASNVSIRAKDLYAALDRRREGAPVPGLREGLAAHASASLSIPSVGKRLERLVAEEVPAFTGFSQQLEKLAQLMRIPGRFRARRFDDPFYRKLYEPYFRPTFPR